MKRSGVPNSFLPTLPSQPTIDSASHGSALLRIHTAKPAFSDQRFRLGGPSRSPVENRSQPQTSHEKATNPNQTREAKKVTSRHHHLHHRSKPHAATRGVPHQPQHATPRNGSDKTSLLQYQHPRSHLVNPTDSISSRNWPSHRGRFLPPNQHVFNMISTHAWHYYTRPERESQPVTSATSHRIQCRTFQKSVCAFLIQHERNGYNTTRPVCTTNELLSHTTASLVLALAPA